MRMRTLIGSGLAVATVLASTAEAGWPCRRGRCQPWTQGRPIRYQVAPATYQPAPQAHAMGDAGGFLATLNQWRAAHGRGPLAWDAGLAAHAASNAGIHQPGTNGGAGQCWAGVASLDVALRMWFASPAHASILLNASTSVGASLCPSGATCNAR